MKKLRCDIERFLQFMGHAGPVSNLKFLRTCINPRMLPVTLIRLSEFFFQRRLGIVAKLFSMVNVAVFGIESSPQVNIGGGLFLPHTVGTVLGADRIGDNVTILQGVTLGTAEPDNGFMVALRPIIGNHVVLGAGAKVIGRITIGDYAKIGANAVVLQDVPPYAIAVGVPARIILRTGPDNLQEKNCPDFL
ncbi:MAG: serine O-acetyltransferase EpsC [Pseudomonadota bacterium]